MLAYVLRGLETLEHGLGGVDAALGTLQNLEVLSGDGDTSWRCDDLVVAICATPGGTLRTGDRHRARRAGQSGPVVQHRR
jgi:hypothetical protein